ncbi:MAG: sugar nucleotide-binding protein, partial [Leptospiraceae bacterium]|nr:sugar nucleotide-binding protein [Leptospiraceae bacterium]
MSNTIGIDSKKILISGGNGMLGTDLTNLLKNLEVKIHSCTIDDLNICDLQSIESVTQEFQPDIFINCAAYTAVDKSETDPLAMQINGNAIKNLAEVCSKKKIKLVHFSTDYIYSGNFSSPIKETETPNPLNKYGETKLKGDNFILNQDNLDFILFRVQWLYGKHGKNF